METIRTEDDRVTSVLYDLQQLNTYTSDKKWTVTFTDEVDDNSVTDETIYVLNAQGKRELVTTDVNGNELFVYAPSGGYAVGDYTLYVDGAQSISAVTLKERATKSFTVKK